ILSWGREETAEYIEYINDHDCQATAHAVGDLAVEYMVEGYEKALKKYPRKPEEHRHRIEHCAITDDDLVNRMAKMGIIPVSNTHFMTINGSDYCKYYGDRIEHFFAMRSYLDAGLKPVIGCDAPTATPEVTRGLDGAVNRIDRKTGKVCGASQRISMMEAIRCYTINGAYASFEDDIKGSIEVGKLADLVVFDKDILAINPVDIVNCKVDYTMIDGKICYKREK
ncbi:MAG: amidohydrolase family protein, partial [Clostridia bacterium]|nr:amidohydrolase family protein [Clostridia bacterium]